jgi:hypothetical protein
MATVFVLFVLFVLRVLDPLLTMIIAVTVLFVAGHVVLPVRSLG